MNSSVGQPYITLTPASPLDDAPSGGAAGWDGKWLCADLNARVRTPPTRRSRRQGGDSGASRRALGDERWV